MSNLSQEFKVIHNTGDYVGDEPPKYFDFKYEADHFQKYGFDAISKNHNILVTAHTGAGKTALALYAIAKWLTEEIIWLSILLLLKHLVIKNLKNLMNILIMLVILTGDVKINPSGQLLIMTAEILRN